MGVVTIRTGQAGDPIAALVAQITHYQDERGLSDHALAARLGVPRSTWTAAKNGRFRPGLRFVQQVAHRREFRATARDILVPGGRARAAVVAAG